MIRCLVVILGCLWAANSAIAQSQLQFAKPVNIPPQEQDELIAISLDSDVYAATRSGYPDLRVLDGTDNEVPSLVRRVTTKVGGKTKQVWTAEDIALRPLEDDGLEITFRIDLDKHPEQPQGIRLLTPLRNFEHHVQVESSVDGQSWQTLVGDGLIFDYSQYMDVQNLAVELPAAEGEQRSWLRITIKDVTQEQQSQLLQLSRKLDGEKETSRTEQLTIKRQPFRIDRIELWHDEMRRDMLRDLQVAYPLAVKRTEQNTEAHQTHIYLESRREPLTQFTLETADRNFSRAAQVEVLRGASGKESWQSIGSAQLTHLDFRSLQRESLSIDITEQRETEYRLVIENRDSPPLSVKDVVAHGNAYEVVFLAAPEAEYRLAYGHPTLEAANLDTAALAASLNEGFNPIVASLGEAVESAVVPAAGDPLFKRLLNNGPFLTAVIAGLVVLLGWGLYRATRKLDGSVGGAQP